MSWTVDEVIRQTLDDASSERSPSRRTLFYQLQLVEEILAMYQEPGDGKIPNEKFQGD